MKAKKKSNILLTEGLIVRTGILPRQRLSSMNLE